MGDTPWKKWERTVAEAFSRWLSETADKEPRAVGGRVVCRQSLMGRMVESVFGDLAIHPQCAAKYLPAAQWFMTTFMVDAKNRKAFRLPSLLRSPKHEFWGWWDKLGDDAARAGGKHRLMVMLDKSCGVHTLAFGGRDRDWLMSQCGRFTFQHFVMETPKGDRENPEKVVFCEFESFLEWANPVGLGCPEVESEVPA